jgi:hypothetical protein
MRALSTAAAIDDARPRKPAVARGRGRTRLWVEALAVAWLCWLYDALTNLAPLRLEAALDHARGVLSLERSLHVDPEYALDRWLAARHTLGAIASYYYDNAHFVVTFSLLAFLWWRRSDIYRPLRNSLVLVNLIAFVVFWRYPVAPPRMLDGFVDVVASSHAIGQWHAGSLASHADEVAAMPSLHIAWAAWCGLALWRISRRGWVRALALLYPCVTAGTVLATGNHFTLDVLGGLLALALAGALVELAPRLASLARSRCARPAPGGSARASGSAQGMREPTILAPPARARGATAVREPAYRMSQSCYEVQEQVDLSGLHR